MSQAVIILQARMASTRLPGKVLEPIGARSLLGHCIARLRIGSAAPVMLATTLAADDDCLVAAAAPYGIPVFRGPEHDVLLRYVHAARSMGARYVVRATADNPAIDIDGPERVLRDLRASGADYVVEAGLPYGACVEAITTDALNRAALRRDRRGRSRTCDDADSPRPDPIHAADRRPLPPLCVDLICESPWTRRRISRSCASWRRG